MSYLKPRTKISGKKDDQYRCDILTGHWKPESILKWARRAGYEGEIRFIYGHYYSHKPQMMFDEKQAQVVA